MADICHDTWFIGSRSTIHISNTMQGFSSQRDPNEGERLIYFENQMRSRVTTIDTCRLNLGSGLDLLFKYTIIGNGVLNDNLFKISLSNTIPYNLMATQENVGIKRCIMNEKSSKLWHRRLGHISIEKIKRLVNDGVVETLDFTNFSTCVDCIK